MGNEREGYMAGVPCWVDTVHDDPAAAAAFYGGVLGWEMEDALPPDAGAHYFMARVDGRLVAAVGSRPETAPAAWSELQAAGERRLSSGGTVVREGARRPGAGRRCRLALPYWQAQ